MFHHFHSFTTGWYGWLGFQICEFVYVLCFFGEKKRAIRFGDLWGEHFPEAFWKLPPTIPF